MNTKRTKPKVYRTIFACALGVTGAIVAAVRKGWPDMLIGRLADAIMAVPPIIFALIMLALAGARCSH